MFLSRIPSPLVQVLPEGHLSWTTFNITPSTPAETLFTWKTFLSNFSVPISIYIMIKQLSSCFQSVSTFFSSGLLKTQEINLPFFIMSANSLIFSIKVFEYQFLLHVLDACLHILSVSINTPSSNNWQQFNFCQHLEAPQHQSSLTWTTTTDLNTSLRFTSWFVFGFMSAAFPDLCGLDVTSLCEILYLKHTSYKPQQFP